MQMFLSVFSTGEPTPGEGSIPGLSGARET